MSDGASIIDGHRPVITGRAVLTAAVWHAAFVLWLALVWTGPAAPLEGRTLLAVRIVDALPQSLAAAPEPRSTPRGERNRAETPLRAVAEATALPPPPKPAAAEAKQPANPPMQIAAEAAATPPPRREEAPTRAAVQPTPLAAPPAEPPHAPLIATAASPLAPTPPSSSAAAAPDRPSPPTAARADPPAVPQRSVPPPLPTHKPTPPMPAFAAAPQPASDDLAIGDQVPVVDPYLRQLWSAIEHERRAQAQRGPAQSTHDGIAIYQILLSRSGALLAVMPAGSSGNPPLDQTAERLIRQAQPFPPLPRRYPDRAIVTITLHLFPGQY